MSLWASPVSALFVSRRSMNCCTASVRASSDAANTASVRVLEKLGFTLTRRETMNGLDTLVFDRVRDAVQE